MSALHTPHYCRSFDIVVCTQIFVTAPGGPCFLPIKGAFLIVVPVLQTVAQHCIDTALFPSSTDHYIESMLYNVANVLL